MREDREKEEEEALVKKGLRVRKGDVVALKQIIFHQENDGVRPSLLSFFLFLLWACSSERN